MSATARSARRTSSLLAVAAGGAAGAVARYGVSILIATPPGTLLANVLGAALLGAFTAEVPATRGLSERTRLAVSTGFLSSFTTYSTFAVEVAAARPPVAVAYVAATYLLGVGAALVGRTLPSVLAREGRE